MATVEEYHNTRRRERRHMPLCPCGNTKSPSYVHCVECRAKRSHWGELPIRPEFPRRLPAAPLCVRVDDWLRFNMRHNEIGKALLEESLVHLGLGVRRYHEWCNGDALMVSVEVADRVLTALGLDWLDVWTREEHPRFAACLDAIDALGEAPADGFCPACNEPVASVNGTCPWHPVPVVVESYVGSEDVTELRRKDSR
jgi:hypothetical protein